MSKFKQLIDKMLSDTSCHWSSPVVLVTIKDGTTRFCVDYRIDDTGRHSPLGLVFVMLAPPLGDV